MHPEIIALATAAIDQPAYADDVPDRVDAMQPDELAVSSADRSHEVDSADELSGNAAADAALTADAAQPAPGNVDDDL